MAKRDHELLYELDRCGTWMTAATLSAKLGCMTRPAAVFAKQAAPYESKVAIANATKGSAAGDASSMLAIMMLGAKQGDEVEIFAEGADETASVDELVALVESGCGE